MEEKAVTALRSLTAAIELAEDSSDEIARIAARLYYWEQLTIRAKVKASMATVMAMASHPAGALAVFVALSQQAGARREVQRCQDQLDLIWRDLGAVSQSALRIASRVTLPRRTKSRVSVVTQVVYANQFDEDRRSVERKVPMRLVYWICVVCQREWYEVRYPNKLPVYCPPTKADAEEGLMSECQRKGLREKQHRWHVRERLKEDAEMRKLSRSTGRPGRSKKRPE
jgi:hypothetical protein